MAARGEPDVDVGQRSPQCTLHGSDVIETQLVVDVDAVFDRHREHVVPTPEHLDQRFDVGDIGIVAEHVTGVGGIRADERDRSHAAQRKDAVVAEQHETPVCDAARESDLLRATRRRRHPAEVDERSFEQPESELRFEHPADREIDVVDRHCTTIDRGPERVAVALGARQFDVDTGAERECRSLHRRTHDVVVLVELLDREVVGDDGAVEAPLSAQHIRQQTTAGATGHAVEFVVGVHDRRQPGLTHRDLERPQVHVAQLAFRQVGRRPVHAALRRPVAHEVFGGGDHAVGQIRTVDAALEAGDEGDPHLRDEVRVFAVGLLEAAPTGVSTDVEDGRQTVMGADCPHLGPDGCGQSLVELGIERRRDADRLREHGRLTRHQARADLLVDDRRYAQSGVVEQVPLHVVREAGRLDRRQAARSAHPGDVADPVAQQGIGPVGFEPAAPRDLEDPDAAELRELLVDRHPAEDIGGAVARRGGRIAVER